MSSDQRRRGDEVLQMHHGVATKLGNGQTRLHSNYPGVTLRRDPIVAYDPHYSHLASVDRRESTASATSSLGSFESASTLTSDVGDTAIMTRLRKSFEQKEEFLRRGVTQTQEPSLIKSNNAHLPMPNALSPDGIGDNGMLYHRIIHAMLVIEFNLLICFNILF